MSDRDATYEQAIQEVERLRAKLPPPDAIYVTVALPLVEQLSAEWSSPVRVRIAGAEGMHLSLEFKTVGELELRARPEAEPR